MMESMNAESFHIAVFIHAGHRNIRSKQIITNLCKSDYFVIMGLVSMLGQGYKILVKVLDLMGVYCTGYMLDKKK